VGAQLAAVRVGRPVFVLVAGAASQPAVRSASALAGPSVSVRAVAVAWGLVSESVLEDVCAARSQQLARRTGAELSKGVSCRRRTGCERRMQLTCPRDQR
jgi:hypothetical protein